MPRISFEQMPDDARVWIFAADRPVSENEQAALFDTTDTFLEGWAAHGVPLTNARELKYGQFLMIAVDEAASGASGCSIDAMVRSLRSLEQELGLTLIDHGAVQFRSPEGVKRAGRQDFATMASHGTVNRDTTVFNNTVSTVGEVRGGKWETAAADSWHADAFF